MGASSVTGLGYGAANDESRVAANRNLLLTAPRVVAAGLVQSNSGVAANKYTVMFPYALKNGIDKYVVTVKVENPLPADGGNEFTSSSWGCNITKLDDRWTLEEQTWVFHTGTPGKMKGFVIHTNDVVGGGEGSRETQLMWSVMTIGFDPSELDVV